MIKLLTYTPGFGEPSLSPFCVKAMILLDLAGVDWAPDWQMMPPKEAYGKLPALRPEDGAALIPDSTFICDWLEARGADLFPGLDSRGRAQAHAVIRMVEENLRFGVLYYRWARAEGWAQLKPQVFGNMPAPLRLLLPGIVRSSVLKTLDKQGISRFSDADRMRNLGADLDALEALLGEQPWLFGVRPTAADAAVLPILSMLSNLPGDSDLRRDMRRRTRLMDYVAKGRDALYPAWFRAEERGETPAQEVRSGSAAAA